MDRFVDGERVSKTLREDFEDHEYFEEDEIGLPGTILEIVRLKGVIGASKREIHTKLLQYEETDVDNALIALMRKEILRFNGKMYFEI